MKKLFYFVLFLTIVSSCKKSTESATGIQKALITSSSGSIRYKNEIFTEAQVKVTKDIIYRNLVDYAAGDQIKGTLKFNFYEPINDLVSIRPLIIYMHGGGWQGGSKDDIGIDSACRIYAMHGFAVVALNYRLDPTLSAKKSAGTLTLKNQAEALYRATQDARFAIRFIKKNAIIGKIDTNKIFIGGGSAGALNALHATYLDDNEVKPYVINQSALGKLDYGGESFNSSSRVRAAFAVAGALIDTNWVQLGNPPSACVHSTGDNLIPIDFGLEGWETLYVYGGRSINKRLKNLGIPTSYKQYNDPITPRPPLPGGMWTHGASINSDIQFFCDFIYTLL